MSQWAFTNFTNVTLSALQEKKEGFTPTVKDKEDVRPTVLNQELVQEKSGLVVEGSASQTNFGYSMKYKSALF